MEKVRKIIMNQGGTRQGKDYAMQDRIRKTPFKPGQVIGIAKMNAQNEIKIDQIIDVEHEEVT